MFEMSIYLLYLDISLHIETLKFLYCCLAHIVLLVNTNGAECFSLSYRLLNWTGVMKNAKGMVVLLSKDARSSSL